MEYFSLWESRNLLFIVILMLLGMLLLYVMALTYETMPMPTTCAQTATTTTTIDYLNPWCNNWGTVGQGQEI